MNYLNSKVKASREAAHLIESRTGHAETVLLTEDNSVGLRNCCHRYRLMLIELVEFPVALLEYEKDNRVESVRL